MTHAIVLAGGLGTRLQGVVNEVPKPMAPIVDRPFLEIQLDYLIQQGIHSVTLCTGHLSEIIENHFGAEYKSLALDYSIETTPLGTGGAIKKALRSMDHREVVILNGDSFFEVDLRKMNTTHGRSGQSLTLALKHKNNIDRYGTVAFDHRQKIKRFEEKGETKSGWINGGVYILEMQIVEDFPTEASFSFESFITDHMSTQKIGGFLSDGYFIDIGTPEDYSISQSTLPLVADNSFNGWTLFLDRDGVINKRTPGDYVKSVKEWIYCEGALEAISQLSLTFERIIVVTNQQGVALRKMSSYTLELLHQKLKDDVRQCDGHIDAAYASTDLKDKPNNSRKPNTTMALWAQRDFPQIDFQKSIMVGDSASDIEFGQALGMGTACVDGKFEDIQEIKALQPDWHFKDLAHFAKVFSKPSDIFELVNSRSALD